MDEKSVRAVLEDLLPKNFRAAFEKLLVDVSEIKGDLKYIKDNFLGANDVIELRKQKGGSPSGLPQAAKPRN